MPKERAIRSYSGLYGEIQALLSIVFFKENAFESYSVSILFPSTNFNSCTDCSPFEGLKYLSFFLFLNQFLSLKLFKVLHFSQESLKHSLYLTFSFSLL